jgi:hypothetical protein
LVILSRYFRGVAPAAVLLAAVAHAQAPAVYLNPQFLIAGGGDQTLTINYSAPLPIKGRWNGQARDLVSSGTLNSFSLQLFAVDLVKPSLATLTLYDEQTSLLLATVYVPVAYNVQLAAVTLDQKRNRLYVATPPVSSDPQFPPNSVISIDPNSGSIVGTLNAGASLGPLAISDDGTVLYVVVSGSTIRRIDPDKFVSAGDVSLPPGTSIYGQPTTPAIKGLAVMPGSTATLAAYYFPDPQMSGAKIAILDKAFTPYHPAKRENRRKIWRAVHQRPFLQSVELGRSPVRSVASFSLRGGQSR